ncbi:MAG: methylenetetrahydrofolate--tRNA-(uracil(54)-C(5))-methyltransferase (FADH(2)-oxidizing) TrmFO [Myxococcales bacterium]|nr:methylenetetrahydrofolate--tRNA-(uracil(54)-C(5))-methyltransferase (FADH(2)-oxidizing) TrmFO [Myxococcales bacterium]
MSKSPVTIVGAGLAGSEAAYQLAIRGVPVRLLEMKPLRFSEAHKSPGFAELVCSNSFRSSSLQNAVGLLKEELRRLGSLNFRVADEVRVPAGDALAVDRERFSAAITDELHRRPEIEIEERVVTTLPAERPMIIATGPLTGSELAAEIQRLTGEALYFYDAISPIVEADSIDLSKAFFDSRYGKGSPEDYLNCPLGRDEYYAFVDALLAAECVPSHTFEEPKYFPGCLPIEVMAESGRDTLAFGPMKPVGLTDPRTGQRPYAVVQLRRENVDGTAYNLVGFQTKLKWGEQKRLFRMIPGLEQAEFLRMGSIHRNTYLDGPRLLGPSLELDGSAGLYFAGQITGVEGYVESTAIGLLAALNVYDRLCGRVPLAPPATTAIGALLQHVTVGPLSGAYQPNNVHFGLFPALENDGRYAESLGGAGKRGKRLRKSEKRALYSERALADLEAWLVAQQLARSGADETQRSTLSTTTIDQSVRASRTIP